MSEKHPDEHYYGGAVWRDKYLRKWMVSPAYPGFILIPSPDSFKGGSMVYRKSDVDHDIFFSIDELKEFLEGGEYLGQFYFCNIWRCCLEDALSRDAGPPYDPFEAEAIAYGRKKP